jgi:hypothetical protein
VSYRVVQILGWPQQKLPASLDSAYSLREEYGLEHLSVDTVHRMWSEYSLGGWFNPDKESVESVFQVVLEKLYD